MQQVFAYISAHWMEGAIWLLGIGWGYLVKKVTEYKTIKDGLLDHGEPQIEDILQHRGSAAKVRYAERGAGQI